MDLETCISIATERNLEIKQGQISNEQAELNYKQSKYNMLPDITASGGQFVQSGRSIDRFTNTFVQNTVVSSNNFSANASAVLFAGGQLRNTAKAGYYAWLATEYDIKNIEQNIALNVANLFLQIAQAQEQKDAAEKNKQNSLAQLDRAQKMLEAGVANEGMVLSLKAQVASDDAAIMTASNAEQQALIALKMQLRLPFDSDLKIILPSIPMAVGEKYFTTVDVIFDSAAVRRPEIKSAEMRAMSANYRVKAAKGAFYPTITVGGSMSTLYSSNAKEITGTTLGGFQPIGRVQNTNEIVESPQVLYTLQTTAFSNQIKNNFGQSLGINLNIPVFNKFQTQTAVKNANLEAELSRINAERTKQNLYTEVSTAYNSFEAARNRFNSAKTAYEAQKLNLDFIQKRFQAGAASNTELILAKSTEAAVYSNMISARYEYVFRKLVLDFYMGEPIKL